MYYRIANKKQQQLHSDSRSSSDDVRVAAVPIHRSMAKSVMHAPEVISCVFIAIALFQLMRNGKYNKIKQVNPSNAQRLRTITMGVSDDKMNMSRCTWAYI